MSSRCCRETEATGRRGPGPEGPNENDHRLLCRTGRQCRHGAGEGREYMTDIAATAFAKTATVGFIGLGHMGGPMARCMIRAGLPVIVQDISPAAAQAIAGGEARIAATPAELAAEADVIFMSLP